MKKSLTEFVETFIVGLFLSILIMVFVGQSLEISGDSMLPTLINNERIIVEKVTYKNRGPKRGEIVVFRSFQNDNIFLIKRVIAIPGDTLELGADDMIATKSPDGSTYPDGKANNLGVLSKYLSNPVPEGNYVVMGDNRNESYDSRMFGVVALDKFVGKAFVVYWPPSKIRKL
jgi:signal peptidase I